MKRSVLLYAFTLLVFGSGMAAILWFGSPATEPLSVPAPIAPDHTKNTWTKLPLLLLQLSLIIGFIKIFSALFRRFGQPRVVVEILAGIVLGPSILGYFWPASTAFLFPENSLPTLEMFSQLGLILFMFVVGLHVDINSVRQRANVAISISHTVIIFSFFLGVSSAWFLYPRFAGPSIEFLPFALFMGIAMSITAFPVLARIISERQLKDSPIGVLALTVAAIDDITAWCLLALVVAIAKSGPLTDALITLSLTIAHIGLMFYVVRPGINYWLQRNFNASSTDQDRTWMTMTILLIFLSALTTELIGIHALFGAFLAGVIMPKMPQLRQRAAERVEYVSELVLLPLFFALVGLRTRFDGLTSADLWWICAWITLVAITGKMVGGALAARLSGHATWREAWLLGALLNTRGLMEIIILTIGYELGILSTDIFTILVLMALITTVMTGPLVTLFTGRRQQVTGTFTPAAAAPSVSVASDKVPPFRNP